MDNIDCSHGHEVLEDCEFNGWGVHNCQHNADIGVICLNGISSINVTWILLQYVPVSSALCIYIKNN